MNHRLARWLLCGVLLSTVWVPYANGSSASEPDSSSEGPTTPGRDELVEMLETARAVWKSDPHQALVLTSRVLEEASPEDHPRLVADTYWVQGLAHLSLDRFEAFLDSMQRAERLYETVGDELAATKCVGFRAIGHSNMGEVRAAIDVTRQALDRFRVLGDDKSVAAATNNLGIYLERTGQYEQALRSHLESIQIERSLGRTIGIANNLNSIGNIHSKLEDHDEARRHYHEALDLFRELEEVHGTVQCLTNIAVTYENQGENERALEYLKQALVEARESGRPVLESTPLTNLGVVHRNLGDYAAALASYRQAAAIEQASGLRGRLAITVGNIGETLLLMNRPTEATEQLERSLELAEETESRTAIEAALLNLSAARAQMGAYSEANSLLTRYTQLHDASLGEEHRRTVAELQAQYDADRRREEIKLLTRDNEIQRLQLSRTRLTAGLTITISILVLGTTALLFHRYRSLLAFWKKRVFVGPYRIGNEISSGGMGVVYEATSITEPNRTVALKVIRDELSGDVVQRRRFINEGQIIDSIRHPNIVTVFDRGEHNERLYIAMEYLQGRTLAEVIASHADRGNHLADRFSMLTMCQLADAVSAIHTRGIVHRDIKPTNVVICNGRDRHATAKLLDFGAAKLDTMTTVTAVGELVGTLSYLAPERIRNEDPSAASDIFSLGAVYYEMLTLSRPFPGDDPVELIRQLLEHSPTAPRAAHHDLDERLDTLVMRMLDKNPVNRPQGAEILDRLHGLQTELIQ